MKLFIKYGSMLKKYLCDELKNSLKLKIWST